MHSVKKVLLLWKKKDFGCSLNQNKILSWLRWKHHGKKELSGLERLARLIGKLL